jgi:hypothetical protein
MLSRQEVIVFEISHIFVLSQPDLVRARVDDALSGRFRRLFRSGRATA